ADDGQAPFNVSDSTVEITDSQWSATAHCDPDRHPRRWVQLPGRHRGLCRKLLLLADDSLDLVPNPNPQRTFFVSVTRSRRKNIASLMRRSANGAQYDSQGQAR